MLDQFFLIINTWMTGSFTLAALGCFLWGVTSVLFSPCHLASIPLIIGYVGGQDRIITGSQAFYYALLFTAGVFITIAMVGIICALLGRMLGDVGPYWTILVGFLLLWVGADMLGISQCSLPGRNLLQNLKIRGLGGAFILGLGYGILSGSCTFGFIAPILAVITIQEKIATGIILITLFGIGHCLPIVVAGSSAAAAKRLLDSSSFQFSSQLFRKGAGLLVAGLGIYFFIHPFI